MANTITGIRILCSIALLFFPAFSPGFYALYVAAGFSDMIDGTVARKTGTVSEFGSKLDTGDGYQALYWCRNQNRSHKELGHARADLLDRDVRI